MGKKLMSFRFDEQARSKLKALALGERTSLTEIIERLIENAPVEHVEVVRGGMTLRTDGTQNKSAAGLRNLDGAFAN